MYVFIHISVGSIQSKSSTQLLSLGRIFLSPAMWEYLAGCFSSDVAAGEASDPVPSLGSLGIDLWRGH